MEKCPICQKEFEKLYTVPVNRLEPMTSVDAMKGLDAYGVYDAPKTILHYEGEWVHFAFLTEADPQPPDAPEGQVWMEPGEERLVRMEILDQQALAEAHRQQRVNPERCQHVENEIQCEVEGIPCYMSWTDVEPHGYYCTDHAHANGFCPMCGLFYAGFESFDFSPTGLCESCQGQVESEFDDEDWDDDDYEDEDDYGDNEFYDEDDLALEAELSDEHAFDDDEESEDSDEDDDEDADEFDGDFARDGGYGPFPF